MAYCPVYGVTLLELNEKKKWKSAKENNNSLEVYLKRNCTIT